MEGAVCAVWCACPGFLFPRVQAEERDLTDRMRQAMVS